MSHRPRKLSKHKTFQKNHRSILRALVYSLSIRSLRVRVVELCRRAKISPTTFYLHFENADQAYQAAERQLLNSFRHTIPTHPSRELTFTLLLAFLAEHRNYFRMAFHNLDHHVIHKMLQMALPINPSFTTPQAYDIYLYNLIAVISIWVNHEQFSREKAPLYVQKLLHVRIMTFRA